MSIALIIGGLCYALNLNLSASQTIYFSSGGVGPTYFPNILTALLVLLCVVTLYRNFRDVSSENVGQITTHNFWYIIATFALVVAFIASWQLFGYFYLNVFIFLTVLLTIFRMDFGIGNGLLVGATTSAFTTGFLYVLFGKILTISF
jgi:hypothetical protein